ncbi:iron-sulfur cluster assembly scaffold protein [Maricaulis sp. CAU 1757]
MTQDLYSNAVLRLAADIPRIGRLAEPDASVRKVSRLCGSELELDLDMVDGRVSDLALRVKACALGQAAAAVLARHGVGASIADIVGARDALNAMLKQGEAAPTGRFADLAALEAARDYPARHQSILLAFEAAAEAVRIASGDGTTTTRATG